MSVNYDLNLLENLTEQQVELLNALSCACETVEQCSCTKKLSNSELEVIIAQLTKMKTDIEQSREITSELTETLGKDTALVSLTCEDFAYWCL